MTKYAPDRETHRAKKELGQNFLVDNTVCPRIAERAKIEGIGVLEVGPGFGALTVELAKRAAKVVAIEIDPDVLPKLRDNLIDYSNTEIILGDAMELDLRTLIRERFGEMPVALVGNLPYYITSPLITKFLLDELPLQSITVMVQKEAGQRLCAKPGTRECGAVSAAVWYYSEPKVLFDVKPGAFRPRPKVMSSVIQLRIRDHAPVDVSSPDALFRVVRAAFGQRRKTAVNAVSSMLDIPKKKVETAIRNAGLPAAVRAEQISLEDFAHLTETLENSQKE